MCGYLSLLDKVFLLTEKNPFIWKNEPFPFLLEYALVIWQSLLFYTKAWRNFLSIFICLDILSLMFVTKYIFIKKQCMSFRCFGFRILQKYTYTYRQITLQCYIKSIKKI